MTPLFLVDTHIVIRYLQEPRKLSREQSRVLNQAHRRQQYVAFSAVSLLEIVAILSNGRFQKDVKIEDLLSDLQTDPLFQMFPVTYDIAKELATLGPLLRDPADRAIVATARVHRLKLLTSDQRIIGSKLVPVVD
jgi:PIN domain nuclease of toxin-antitoxin system